MTERDRLRAELAAVVALEKSIRARMGAERMHRWRRAHRDTLNSHRREVAATIRQARARARAEVADDAL